MTIYSKKRGKLYTRLYLHLDQLFKFRIMLTKLSSSPNPGRLQVYLVISFNIQSPNFFIETTWTVSGGHIPSRRVEPPFLVVCLKKTQSHQDSHLAAFL